LNTGKRASFPAILILKSTAPNLSLPYMHTKVLFDIFFSCRFASVRDLLSEGGIAMYYLMIVMSDGLFQPLQVSR